MGRQESDAEPSADGAGKLSNRGKIFTSLAAGGIAGGVAKTVIAPLDRSKIFFQTNETRNYRFRYALRWLRHGYRTEGFLSLWRGNTATLARIVPYSAINFMSFEQYKKVLRVEERDRPGVYRFIAGSMAGSTGQVGQQINAVLTDCNLMWSIVDSNCMLHSALLKTIFNLLIHGVLTLLYSC